MRLSSGRQFVQAVLLCYVKIHEKHTIQKLRVQTLFLLRNPCGSKRVEDAKNRTKALI